MMSNGNPNEYSWGRAITKWLFLAAGLLVVGWIVYNNLSTLVLLAFSLMLAYLLNPLVTTLNQKGISRSLSIGVLLLATVLILCAIGLVVVPSIIKESRELIWNEEQMDSFYRWMDQEFYPSLKPYLREMGIVDWNQDVIRDNIQRVLQWINSYYPQWFQPLLTGFQSMFTGIASFIVGLLNLLLLPVFTFYLLRDYPSISRSLYASIPPQWGDVVSDWLQEIDQVVGGFIRGQFSIALILAVINAVGLTLIGVPFGFMVGTIAGLANMVPYMSIIVGLIPALILSFVDNAEWIRLLWVGLIFGGAQMLEGFVLNPKIMGKEVGLHPVLIMLSIIIGGSLFGLVGIILAVPTAAILKVVAVRSHLAWKQTWPKP